MPTKLNIPIGTKFSSWTVISAQTIKLGKHTKIHVQCKCGTTTFTRFRESKACMQCGRSTTFIEDIPYHHRRRLMGRISAAIRRCLTKSNPDYPDYGGRGIKVYQPWIRDRLRFLKYLTSLPGWDNPNLTLDRADNNGHYEPGNLRFVTQKVQANNRRKRKK